ncbi:hypothetical protein HZQ01_14200 [Elizabethkingia anophelis]|nr:hypothetical protein [Elizabethkingia anophelis]
MQALTIAAEISTVLSLIVSLIALFKISKIEKKINNNMNIEGDKNVTAGKDVSIKY